MTHKCTVTCDQCGAQTTVRTREQTYTAAIYALPERWFVRHGLQFCCVGCARKHEARVSDELSFMGAA